MAKVMAMIRTTALILVAAIVGSAPVFAEGNRYGYPRDYKSDISPAAAHQELTKNKKSVLIDVRSVEEFASGHPPMAEHVPYPTARGRGRDDPNLVRVAPEEFLADILAKIPDKSTPIITMCSGGGRSAMA
ncbi:MAG: rhodanese-like domain-containing protein, partial [Alphaproteobacteria bacterium]|nr:rhodanese-like domain-containing protein [Alphaproteobacteria bacterium]